MKKEQYQKASILDCLENYYQTFDKVYDSNFQKEANISNARILLLRKIRETEKISWRKAHERFSEIATRQTY